ncbi:Non-specific serine/threonine protein kinase [Handroanthus impetiginosus]|uniref:Non-specific serine/threonine protein kinase n=1 Tax=Handroanthus impetiginosus TaxID=429701 RepID=A0A2G9I3B7_9LAMI|nr:Non-specific serine/threonine protein kinase [Handroanthus impetiginosus]
MLNGSLDYHLFGRRSLLSWTLRYKIACGLASALLYLHEEWEQCVLHRGIKSSNVMLDSNFNVKLGDFGLARLMHHEIGPQNTVVAGTLGYLDPKYMTTGRISKELDVYSFEVVALEIATGRKLVDKQSEKGLVEWVWDLYGNGEFLSILKQVECLMIIGLWCAHLDWNLRPSIRQANRALSFETDFPQLPKKKKKPIAMYYVPSSPWISAHECLVASSSTNVG